ncbi:MAG: hypothetical protein RBT60_12225 [Candidatus Krumholzibacteria bacterium]|jgi:hypothetical protein|nr:hypothetical protein [Candidatus Krumholzibacteria bacterium]
MRILFFYPDLSSTMTDYTSVLSHGVAQLSAAWRRHGHETAPLHLAQLPDRDSFIATVRAVAPIVVGGVHATIAPDEIAAGYVQYKALRHRVGESLVHRVPRLYRFLGGTDPV